MGAGGRLLGTAARAGGPADGRIPSVRIRPGRRPPLGLALWRPPLVALWMTVAVGATSVGLAFWWRGQIPIQQAGGEVVVTGGPLVQTDGWTYQAGSRDVFATLRWTEVSRPIYPSRQGLDDVWVSLNCDTSGRPREFAAWIPAGR